MAMRNDEVAALFDTLADVLAFKGENAFKVNAYRRVARVIRDLTEDLAVLARENRLRDLPGVGEAIEAKIVQALKEGHITRLDEAMKDVPPGILEMMQLPGVGPRTAMLVYQKLGIKTVGELAEAARAGTLSNVPGFGEKKSLNLLRGIDFARQSGKRMTLGDALPLVESIQAELSLRGFGKVTACGSLRRMCETVGDIDLLAADPRGAALVRAFTTLPMIKAVLAAGPTKGSVRMENGVQVDLRVVPAESFGAALQYFTGSKAHNIRVRALAVERGLKLNEYGVFKGEKRIAGATEEEVYRAVGLPHIAPVLREDRGEIEAAQAGALPALIELKDIRGDLHVHTDWSDGNSTIEEMACAARNRGYRYVVISDHTQALKVFGGLDPARLGKQIAEVRRVGAKLKGITLLTGAEVDIRADGSLDLPDEMLAKLDFVTASVHSAFTQDREKMTRRILRAVEHPYVHAIGHLTGRILNQRRGYDLDLEAVLKAAARTGTALELNANPARLDITDQVCRRARELRVRVVINTDAHSPEDLSLMRYGIATAQRGWLGKGDVLNTRARPPKGKRAG